MLQPLDVSINKPFKGWLRASWAAYIADESKRIDVERQSGNTAARIRPPSKQLLVDWISAAVEKLRERTDVIRKSFIVTGISTALNCRDDHLVRRDENECDSDNSDEDFYGFTPEEIGQEISDYSDSDTA